MSSNHVCQGGGTFHLDCKQCGITSDNNTNKLANEWRQELSGTIDEITMKSISELVCIHCRKAHPWATALTASAGESIGEGGKFIGPSAGKAIGISKEMKPVVDDLLGYMGSQERNKLPVIEEELNEKT